MFLWIGAYLLIVMIILIMNKMLGEINKQIDKDAEENLIKEFKKEEEM